MTIDADFLWKAIIIVVNIGVLVLQFFISRTLKQYDATNRDHEERLREVESKALSNSMMTQKILELNEKTFQIVQVHMDGLKGDIDEFRTDMREIKNKIA